jgi:hypothetical protein
MKIMHLMYEFCVVKGCTVRFLITHTRSENNKFKIFRESP